MATVPSSTLQLSKSHHPLFSPRPPPQIKLHAPPYLSSTTTRATTDDTSPETDETQSTPSSEPDSFESRLSQVRVRYRSGTGKKAEVRKTRKGKRESAEAGIYLPPVALKEAVSDGLNVKFGFSPYSERVNGRIAILGLSALLLVEVATGKSVINYHTPAIVFIQVYFVAAVSALYVKYEKEKISVWPKSSPAQK